MQALKRVGLRGLTEEERCLWAEEARVAAILGSCPRSIPMVQSGYRCYVSFMGAFPFPHPLAGFPWSRVRFCSCADALRGRGGGRRYLPPQLGDLLTWSTLFRCSGTLSNYLGYVKTACLLVNASPQVRGR